MPVSPASAASPPSPDLVDRRMMQQLRDARLKPDQAANVYKAADRNPAPAPGMGLFVDKTA